MKFSCYRQDRCHSLRVDRMGGTSRGSRHSQKAVGIFIEADAQLWHQVFSQEHGVVDCHVGYIFLILNEKAEMGRI